MRQLLFSILSVPVFLFFIVNLKARTPEPQAEKIQQDQTVTVSEEPYYTITDIVRPGETLAAIFNKHRLGKQELNEIYQSARKEYDLSKISVGSVYSFKISKSENEIRSMQYGIDDVSFLDIARRPDGFSAEKVNVRIDKKIGYLYINIRNSLTNSMPGTHREYGRLALALADIYAWDIDFSHEIRNGDSVKIIVEELWAGEVFKGFGDILAAEFTNNGKTFFAYRFEYDGYADYYDRDGKSLRKSLLRSPLKFKYISSGFSRRRLHPKFRVYRPHLGIDYAARTGTPVSAAGNGTVILAGYKGQNGKMVKIKHPGGYETYYGHLSRIPRKIQRGTKVSQGDIIGYVGSTGVATGPHLDYRIKLKGNFVNPLKIRLPRGKSIPGKLMAGFRAVVNSFDSRLASVTGPVVALEKKKKTSG